MSSALSSSMELQLRPGSRALLLVKPYGPTFQSAMQKLMEDPTIQIFECESATDAAAVAQRLDRALILVHVASYEDATHNLPLLRVLMRLILARRVRVVATSGIEDPGAMMRMASAGYAEIFPEAITGKSLAFKLDRHIRTIPAQAAAVEERLNQVRARASEEIKEAPKIEVSKKTRSAKNTLLRVAPLELESDCWSAGRTAVKRIGGRWVIRLYGPPPSFGRWTEIPESDSYWQWSPNNFENDPFIKEQGAWVFHGQKPEFQDDMWTFIGKAPRLAFFYEGQSFGAKFELDESGSLCLAEDSEHSKRAGVKIRDELDRIWQGGGEMEREAEVEDYTQRAEAAAAAGSESVEYLPPLELESDCWTIGANPQKPRRIMGRWLVRLTGPPPSFGRWTELQDMNSGEGDPYFKWVPADEENDPFIKEQGAWVYRGIAPHFEDEAWVLAGSELVLGFYYEGECYGMKLQGDRSGKLKIARDSEAGRKAVPRIESALEKVIRPEKTKTEEKAGAVMLGVEDAATDLEERKSGSEEVMHRYAEEHFGTPGGKWEFAGGARAEDRVYVYVPVEIQSAGGVGVQDMHLYWTFAGVKRPALIESAHGREWGFLGERPIPYEDFGELPRSAQVYLRDRAPSPVFIESGSEEGPQEGQRDYVSTSEPAPERSVRDLIGAVDIPMGTGAEDFVDTAEVRVETPDTKISYEEAAAPQWNQHDLTPDAPSEFHDLRQPEVGKKLRQQGKETIEALEQTADYRQKAFSGPASGVADLAPAQLKGEGALEIVRKAALSTRAPSISPLGLAFLVSELCCNRELTLAQVSARYCEYLSSACGGARAELWIQLGGHWKCVATHDGSGGKFKDEVIRGPVEGGRVAVATIGAGALALEADGLVTVPAAYAEGVSRMAVGIMRSVEMSGEVVGPKVSQAA